MHVSCAVRIVVVVYYSLRYIVVYLYNARRCAFLFSCLVATLCLLLWQQLPRQLVNGSCSGKLPKATGKSVTFDINRSALGMSYVRKNVLDFFI